MDKTNVIRMLESKHIPHTIHTYEVDEDDLSGETVAEKTGANKDSVFKTIVACSGKREIFVFCIPVTAELNLKKAATVSGNKKLDLIKSKELLSITDYLRGGCSPIGMKKKYPVFIDETAQLFESIYVSAGVRGAQIRLNPDDLLYLTDSAYADLI